MVYAIEHRLEKQREAQKRWREIHGDKWVRNRSYEIDGDKVQLAFHSERNTGKYGSKQPKHGIDEARRVSLLMLLGGQCEVCGENGHRCLQIDHVNGGGFHDRQINSSHTNSIAYVWHGAMTGKYQPLCANCNWRKRYAQNEHRS